MNLLKLLTYFFFLGMLLTGSMTTKDSFLLKKNENSKGMLYFQLNPDPEEQKLILKDWESYVVTRMDYSSKNGSLITITGLSVAAKQTVSDYSFIFFYVGFFCLLFYRYRLEIGLRFKILSWGTLAVLLVVGGLFDVMENVATRNAIVHYKEPAYHNARILFTFALLKFTLILLVLIYFFVRIRLLTIVRDSLERMSGFLKSILGLSWKFRIVLLAMLVFLLLISLSDQGRDLLVTINTSAAGIILFYIVVSVFAALNWYLPKVYDQKVPLNLKVIFTESITFNQKVANQIDYARFLGTMTLVIPAMGLLITMNSYHIQYYFKDVPPLLLLVIIAIAYLYIIRYNLLHIIYKPKGQFSQTKYVITMVLILGLISYWGTDKTHNIQPYYLANLSLGFLLLSFAFLLTITYRKHLRYFANVAISHYIIGGGLTMMLFFLAFNFTGIVFTLTSIDRFFSLPLVIAGLITYVMVFSFLLMLGRKFNIQIITFLLLLMFFNSSTTISGFHKVHLVEPAAITSTVGIKSTADRTSFASGDSLKSYVQQWISQRRKEIIGYHQSNPDLPYPIFFVNAHGGGIRAAAWTTFVIGRLDQVLRESKNNHLPVRDFQHYVFSYSGASGGTVGLSLLCASRIQMVKNSSKTDTTFYPYNTLNLFKHDYLTANLVGIFGRDALMSSIGANWYADRARLQEISFEQYMDKSGLHYKIPLSSGWHDKGMDVPLFFSNTYDINTGFKGLIAPVKLNPDDFPGTVLIQDLLKPHQDLLLSTAALISARFPYVSPTAKFDEEHHFTDGGTLENSGAETSLQVIRVFQAGLDSLMKYDQELRNAHIKINILSLPNSIVNEEKGEEAKNMSEIFAPLLGILKSSDGNTRKAELNNAQQAAKYGWNYFSVRPLRMNINNAWPVLPLGWQISNDALKLLQQSVIHPDSKIYPVAASMVAGCTPNSFSRSLQK